MEPIVILYTEEPYLNSTITSIRELGMNNKIIPVYGITDEKLKRHELVSFLFKTRVLPLVKESSFYYTEEGTIWKSIPDIKEHSQWFGYTKITNGRPVGAKCIYFYKDDYKTLVSLFNSKLFHIDYTFSKCDWLIRSKYKKRGVTKVPQDFDFKLVARSSYFETQHPKFWYKK